MLRQEETLELNSDLTEQQEIMQLCHDAACLADRKRGTAAAEASELHDRAQVLFRLYQSVATSRGL